MRVMSKRAFELPMEWLIVVVVLGIVILIILFAFSIKGFSGTGGLFEKSVFGGAGIK